MRAQNCDTFLFFFALNEIVAKRLNKRKLLKIKKNQVIIKNGQYDIDRFICINSNKTAEAFYPLRKSSLSPKKFCFFYLSRFQRNYYCTSKKPCPFLKIDSLLKNVLASWTYINDYNIIWQFSLQLILAGEKSTS